MDLIFRVFFLIVIIPSAIIHEYAHGWTADRLGDPTARLAGRLTLDPRVHVDLWGTIILPLLLFLGTGFLFAYAKPVPYNPYNLKNQRWGSALVGVAGPLSNFLLAFAFAIVNYVLPLSNITKLNLISLHINSALLAPGESLFIANLFVLVTVIIYANVVLGVFNLVPIPPLDGSKLLFALLPDRYNHIKFMLERQGFLLLLIFIFFGFHLIAPVMQFVYVWFVTGFGLFL